MKTIKTLLVISIVFYLTPVTLAQEPNDHSHDHDHLSHGHHAMNNEIGGAVGMVFILEEQETALGFHLHYYRRLPGKMKPFGVSPGLALFLGDHRHYTFHVMMVYSIIHGWWVSAGPGITYLDHDNEFVGSAHVETGYEFDIGKLHLGPVVEYTWAKEGQHIMLGLHLGVPF